MATLEQIEVNANVASKPELMLNKTPGSRYR